MHSELAVAVSQKIVVEGNLEINDYEYNFFGNKFACADSEGNVIIYQKDNENKFKKHSEFKGAQASIWKISWAHPKFGEIIACASFAKKVGVFQFKNNQWVQIAYHYLHQGSVNQVVWAPYYYGLKLYAASSDGSFSLLQIKNNNWLARVFPAHDLSVNSISVQKRSLLDDLDGLQRQYPNVVTASKDRTISIFSYSENKQKYEQILSFVAHKEAVRNVVWRESLSSTPQFFTCSEDGAIKLISLENKQFRQITIFSTNQPILRISQSKTGNTLTASVKQSAEVNASYILQEKQNKWYALNKIQ